MSNSNFDPNEFKLNQRQSWDSVARGWQKWWKTFEKAGTYSYVCNIHPWMTGLVTVN